MTKKMILLFTITVAVAGCNNNSKNTPKDEEKTSSQENEKTESVPSATETNLLQTFTNGDIASHKVNNGCLYSFGSLDDENNFYYADNRDNLAIIKIDNQFIECEAIIGEKIGENPQVYKKYSNGKYTIEFIGSRAAEKGIEDGSKVTGTLKVTDSAGIMLWAKLVRGICAC
jgi:hypothetical protein